MKSIILAAGYATRLYPLTKNFPKPLLKVGEKTILDRLIDDIDSNKEISGHIVVSNHKFVNIFEEWKKSRNFNSPLTVLDDGSTENENRLGAVKDILFAIEKEKIDEDILVLAGDNILDFSLAGFIEYSKTKNASCIMRHFEENTEKLRRTGVASVDKDDKVIKMQEKPAEPQSHWAVPPFYIYKKEDLPFIKKACELKPDGKPVCPTDAPGDFIAWFCAQKNVYAWQMAGHRYDIGNIESLEEARKIFS